MKNIWLFTLLFATSITNAFSQNYQTIEWDILSISSLLPISNNTGNAVALSTEARVNVNNSLSFGLKAEWQFFDEIFEEPVRGLGVSNSFGLTGDYYVKNNINKRIFVGMAVGAFNNEYTTEAGSKVGGKGLGLSPRLGYELNFLRFLAQYNHTLKNDFPNYFSIGVGLNIGGRYK